jgi:hypothetical protein
MPGTTYREKYDASLVLSRVYRENDGWMIDPLSQVILDMCDSITVYDEYVYKDKDVFPSIVYKHYNTTTLGWFVLYFNGLMSPFDLQPGMVLKFPLLEQIDRGLALSQRNESSRKIVVI